MKGYFYRLKGKRMETNRLILRKNIFFWKDENGLPIWKDTYVYAKLKEGQK